MNDGLEQLRAALSGQYDVEKAVGAGGMATVFRAMDVKHERSVAIKVLRADLSVSIGADRFLREIKVAAKLQHPNILGLYDSGSTPEGLVYYVMPFVEGESLRDKLDREKQLPIDEAIQITLEVADALHYAQAQGVIHRDIKPDNILLLKDSGHAMVMDFGIARAVGSAGADKLTQTGMSVGTPHYMSPEQAGGADTVDARADLYSLGCVLYEMLAGQPPFDGPNTMAILARHAMEAVPSLQIVRSTVPDEVEEIVMTALAKTPADRFSTIQQFGEALADADLGAISRRTTARAIPRRTSSFRVPTQMEIPVAPPKRRLPWLVAGAVAVLALGAGGVFWMRQDSGANRAGLAVSATSDLDRLAVLYFRDLSADSSLAFLADGVTEDLIGDFSGVRGVQVISRNGVAPFRGTDIASDSIARVLGVGTLVQGDVEAVGTDKVRVTVRLQDASGTDINRASFEQPLAEPLVLRDAVAAKVAEFLRQRLGDEVRIRQQQAATSSAQAWSLVQRAEQVRRRWDAAQGNPAQQALGASADSLYAAAASIDANWSTPWVGRATLAYKQARLAGSDRLAAGDLIRTSLAYADSALARAPQDGDAFEARGTTRYYAYLTELLGSDSREQGTRLEQARDDLKRATQLSPTPAAAFAALSHLYNRTADAGSTDALLAAQQAYEADTWLANANDVLDRLFTASYDLGQETDAAKWCTEGERRFTDDPRFKSCRLWLMTMRNQRPDLNLGWQIVNSATMLVPGRGDSAFQVRRAQLALAAAIGRAGLRDSARRVAAAAANADGEIDPNRELQLYRAFALGIVKDTTGLVDAMKVFFAKNPDQRKGFVEEVSWWFKEYEAVPAFRELFIGGAQ